jgi:imidazolonepropionase-like amidohydrolase
MCLRSSTRGIALSIATSSLLILGSRSEARLAREVANLVEAGLSNMEAIQAATLRPAQMQGVNATLGTVSPGKLADIIVVDGDPLRYIAVLDRQVVHVVRNGSVVK